MTLGAGAPSRTFAFANNRAGMPCDSKTSTSSMPTSGSSSMSTMPLSPCSTRQFHRQRAIAATRTKGRGRDVRELGLTRRQGEVVQRVARGLANKQIAAELGISERAVKGHVSDLLGKFAVANRAGLIASLMAERGLGLPTDVTRPAIDPALESVLGPADLAAY